VATLDAISRGRAIFAAGLGGPIEDEYGSCGEPTDPVVLAGRLDEGLELLRPYWSGESVNHDGRHLSSSGCHLVARLGPTPRPPVWIGGFWPHRRPTRRAGQCDGAVPLLHPPAPQRRPARPPVEIVLGDVSSCDQAKARDLLGPLADAGATGRSAAIVENEEVADWAAGISA